MGKREDQLNQYLIKYFGVNKYSKPIHEDFVSSQFNSDIFEIYEQLGGLQADYPANFRGFDIQLEDLIIELDEERHFNRYRFLTLNSSYYSSYPYFSVSEYRTWCAKMEKNCLEAAGWRNNWENKNSRLHFGESDPEGVLRSKGASRWKQRAFFDYLRDISIQLIDVPILRISIYHVIKEMTVDEHLKRGSFEPIANYIRHNAI